MEVSCVPSPAWSFGLLLGTDWHRYAESSGDDVMGSKPADSIFVDCVKKTGEVGQLEERSWLREKVFSKTDGDWHSFCL
ncbi:MAG: hypothetical protein MK135_14810 [Polyangiaceae bacterium]|nr:hypothetical protein [Polyangiaceae bacterium]